MGKEDISIKKVIVHILDSYISMPVLSDKELEHGSDLSDFLKAHIYRIISGDDIKKCYFGNEDMAIYNYLISNPNYLKIYNEKDVYLFRNVNTDV